MRWRDDILFGTISSSYRLSSDCDCLHLWCEAPIRFRQSSNIPLFYQHLFSISQGQVLESRAVVDTQGTLKLGQEAQGSMFSQPLGEATAEELVLVIPHILYRVTLCLSILTKGVHVTSKNE